MPDRFFVLIVCTVLLVPALAAGQSIDSVFTESGRPVRGEVTEVSATGLVIASDGAAVTVPAHDVRRINFFDEPAALTKAKASFAEDRFNACLAELEKNEERAARRVVQQELDYYRAMSAAKMALAGEEEITTIQAASLLKDFVEDNSDSYHFFPAVDAYGDLAMANGRFDFAQQQFQRLVDCPWPQLALQGRMKLGVAQLRQDKFDDAIASFTAVEASDQTDDLSQQLKLIASCLHAQALAGTGNPDQGIKMVTEIIQREDADNRPLFAQAYNALGSCHLKAGNQKEALMAFLHTELMYFTEPGPHAESLFYLYQIWTDLKNTDRANEARQRIKDRYRNTHWAAKI